jgi:hypothetical protein
MVDQIMEKINMERQIMKMAQFGKEAHFMEKIRVTVSTFKIG